MAKDKQSHYIQTQRDLTFYYEIVGILSIIIPILGFARLGSIGFYVMLIFKIIFGDWYFLFLLTILLYGLRCLIYHKPLDLKRMRVIGIVLILLGIMILSHFPMHKYIVSFDVDNEGGYFRKTIGLYLDYFKNYYDGMVVGGGIIGACFFYLFYSLLSTVGTTLMIIVFIFVGMVFITEKTINEFLSIIFRRFIWVYKFVKKKFSSFKYDIKVPQEKLTRRRIKLSYLKEPERIKYEYVEMKNADEFKEKLKIILNKMNIFFGDVLITVGYNVTTFLIESSSFIDMSVLNSQIKEITTQKFLIKKDVKTKKTIIELNNTYESVVEIKTVLELQSNYENDYSIPLGLTSLKILKEINLNSNSNLLIEDNENYSEGFIFALITLLHIKNKVRDFKIHIYDKNFYIKRLIKSFDINSLVEIANNTLNKLNEFNALNIDSYNEKVNKEYLKHNIFILKDDIILNKEYVDKIVFLLQISSKIGFHIVFITKNKNLMDIIYDNYFEYQLFFKDSVNLDVSKNLNGNECFLTYKGEIDRMTPVSISKEDINEFKSCF